MSQDRGPASQVAGRGKLRQILILDDDDAFREDLAEMLTLAGHKVESICDPDALTPDRLCRTDILILDLKMPGADGVDVLRNLCRCVQGPQVVLVSGSDEDVIEAAAEAGRMSRIRVLGTLRKPFDPEQLLALIAADVAETHGSGSSGGAPSAAKVLAAVAAALEAGTVPVTFQPKCRADDLSFTGAEALLGDIWPKLGRISPLAVVSALARDPGLFRRLTLHVIERAARGCADWRAVGLAGPVSINLPLDMLTEPQAAARLADTVREVGLATTDVILELTEDAVYASSSEALMVLAQVRIAGFGLALDDVGQRQSGLLQLALLPITELKIDRALIVGSRSTEKSRSILEALIQLGHRLGLKVVAEGVETREDLSRVKEMGVDLVQGYLISRKLGLAELIAMFKEWQEPKHDADDGEPDDTRTGSKRTGTTRANDNKPDHTGPGQNGRDSGGREDDVSSNAQ